MRVNSNHEKAPLETAIGTEGERKKTSLCWVLFARFARSLSQFEMLSEITSRKLKSRKFLSVIYPSTAVAATAHTFRFRDNALIMVAPKTYQYVCSTAKRHIAFLRICVSVVFSSTHSTFIVAIIYTEFCIWCGVTRYRQCKIIHLDFPARKIPAEYLHLIGIVPLAVLYYVCCYGFSDESSRFLMYAISNWFHIPLEYLAEIPVSSKTWSDISLSCYGQTCYFMSILLY